MEIKTQGNTTVIQDKQQDSALLLEKITEQYNSYKDTNLIVDISQNSQITNKDVLMFEKLSSLHKKGKKSFVLVLHEEFDFNAATDKVMIVPTLQEAHDVVEMEEIERDLGF